MLMPANIAEFQSTRPRGARQLGWHPSAEDMQFQSTRPRGARRLQFVIALFASLFQSTRPRGARPKRCMRRTTTRQFQSTRPRGARLGGLRACALGVLFQSTRPRGARRVRLTRSRSRQSFQSTRPRGARRPTFRVGQHIHKVSIHAPARGATSFGVGGVFERVVSIHAPARGATAQQSPFRRGAWRFNPRAREGRDRESCQRLCDVWFQSTRPRGARPSVKRRLTGGYSVSIHAPARGATISNFNR